ncbi:hypothetical protein ACF073_37450 [Streptomyces sp. NPDC015171]|uniref:hypothetical protein n=1 Tax=Streptomyces sp. NPDC015171 TaxID=3364945 RepID=UPI0036FDFE49
MVRAGRRLDAYMTVGQRAVPEVLLDVHGPAEAAERPRQPEHSGDGAGARLRDRALESALAAEAAGQAGTARTRIPLRGRRTGPDGTGLARAGPGGGSGRGPHRLHHRSAGPPP